MDETVGRAVLAGALLLATGLLAWTTGEPLLFPSLGPTAYLFAVAPDAAESTPRRAVGGHALGVLAGFATYHLLASGLALDGPAAGSLDGLRLAVAGVLAVTLTTGGMLATDTGHPPACATTLIVSLGLLTSSLAAVEIVVAVVVLTAVHRSLLALLGDRAADAAETAT